MSPVMSDYECGVVWLAEQLLWRRNAVRSLMEPSNLISPYKQRQRTTALSMISFRVSSSGIHP